MKTRTTKLLVIGGGPGGYVAAIRAGQLGITTTLVEADPKPCMVKVTARSSRT